MSALNLIQPTTEQRTTLAHWGFTLSDFGDYVDRNGHRCYRSDITGEVLFVQIMHCNYSGQATHSQTHRFSSWAAMIATSVLP